MEIVSLSRIRRQILKSEHVNSHVKMEYTGLLNTIQFGAVFLSPLVWNN